MGYIGKQTLCQDLFCGHTLINVQSTVDIISMCKKGLNSFKLPFMKLIFFPFYLLNFFYISRYEYVCQFILMSCSNFFLYHEWQNFNQRKFIPLIHELNMQHIIPPLKCKLIAILWLTKETKIVNTITKGQTDSEKKSLIMSEVTQKKLFGSLWLLLVIIARF